MADDATPTATLADEFFAALEHVAKQRRALRELKGIGPIDLVVCDRGAIDPKVGFPSGVVFSDDPQAKPLMDSLLHCESAAARVFARHPREKEDFESWLKRTGDELAMEARGTFADSPYEKPSVQYKRELAAWRKRLSGEPRPPVPQIPHWEGAYPDDGIRSLEDVAVYLRGELGCVELLEDASAGAAGASQRALTALSNADFALKHVGATGYPDCRPKGEPLPNLKARILDVIAWASDPARLKAWFDGPPTKPASKAQPKEPTPTARLVVDVQNNLATLDGKPFDLSRNTNAALFLRSLIDANGEWVSKWENGIRPDKIKPKLPREICEMIEAESGKGHRIRRETLYRNDPV